ncbi:MAG TPA: SAM-dependent methyltransferase [Actinomycetota bacterium]
MARSRTRLVPVLQLIRSLRPDILDPRSAIADRRLLVDGRFVVNPHALVRADASVTLAPVRALRGEDKLRAALDVFEVEVRDRVCLDVGAAAGGFTRVLLERGARLVYALDAGFGQLRSDLRAHPRVVNLERTNLSRIAETPIRCWPIDLVTLDLSYLSLANAVPQLERVRFAAGADLVALVKPMFELGLPAPPKAERDLRQAVDAAGRGVEAAGHWRVTGSMPSPVVGSRGARELLLHARRV